MSYDPADLKLPRGLIRLLDWLVRIEIPIGRRWRFGMTRPGAMLAGVLFGLWAAAFYSGNNLLYLCGAMLTALPAASIWQTVRLLKKTPELSICLPSFTVAGEPFVFRHELPGVAVSSALVEIGWHAGSDKLDMQLRMESPILISGVLRHERRGMVQLDKQELSTSAPLGLWRLNMVRSEPATWAVLPKPVPWLAAGLVDGSRSRPFEGDELRDLRSYIPGDALSRIHWRKAASDMTRWTVKRFEQHEAQSIVELLRVDLRLPGTIPADQFELLLGRAWHWIETRLQGGGSFRVILGQHHFDPALPAQRESMIMALAAAVPQGMPPDGAGGTLLSLADKV